MSTAAFCWQFLPWVILLAWATYLAVRPRKGGQS